MEVGQSVESIVESRGSLVFIRVRMWHERVSCSFALGALSELGRTWSRGIGRDPCRTGSYPRRGKQFEPQQEFTDQYVARRTDVAECAGLPLSFCRLMSTA